MSLKENLQVAKESFSSDEKIFESAFRLERFFKKYKYLLITLAVVLIGYFLFLQVNAKMEEKRAIEATEIYEKLLKEPNNQALIDALGKKSSQLLEIFLLSQAVKTNDASSLKKMVDSKNLLVKNFATYQLASLEQNMDKLGALSTDGFVDLAKIQQAFLMIEQKKIQEAREVLQSIDQNSVVRELVRLLLHYHYEG
ncbi:MULTISPECIES: tetratricopeptide repeat protein [unclassified Helicobacter]|uniref:tetratricopeptide repeat protein n=1 Tax=unclassified Helicobacter TaxID=2593540 RepID=UPI000CF0A50F|nr:MULTISPECIES: tetratricopeptide repeat protein [unclassified Helicobacter]